MLHCRWYADRPEVRKWQEDTIAEANRTTLVYTLLGRSRPLHGLDKLSAKDSKQRQLKGHLERAAINTPIQGSAADIAAAAMLMIDNDKQLEKLGFKLLLQVHLNRGWIGKHGAYEKFLQLC